MRTAGPFRTGRRPSRTAEYMALFRAVESAEPPHRRLFEDPYAAALLAGPLKALAGFARLPVIGRLAPRFLDLGWPHTRSSGVVRTRLIDDLVRQAIHVRFVPVDFEKDDLHNALIEAGFDKSAPALVVWEGVVSYLRAPAVHENFCMLARILAPGSRVIFSYVHSGALDGSVAFPEARRWKSWVRVGGEPFIFGSIPPGSPPICSRWVSSW